MSDKAIVIDCRMIEKSGIGTYIKSLLPFFLNSFTDVTLLGDIEEITNYTKNQYPLTKLIAFNVPIYSIAEQLQFRKIVPACDIFWSPHYNVPLMPVKAKKRVVTIHDVYQLAFFKDLSLMQKLYVKVVMSKAIKASNKIITVSNFSKNEIIKYTNISPDKITVIHNGVSPKADVESDDVKSAYQLPNKYLLFVGNVKPNKNLGKLLKAYLLLSDELRAEYKLVIAGKKQGFITGDNEVLDLVESNPILANSVSFTGYIQQQHMDSIYANATVLVFPSVYEGFGLPPLEAMINNCPVIASNTSSIPEICGDAALYFDPFDEQQICAQITALLTNASLIKDLLAKGQNRAKLFTWEKSAIDHIAQFKAINIANI